MKYKVHKVEITKDDAQDKLEHFLNSLRGEVVSVVPFVTPLFRPWGATSSVKFILVVEKLNAGAE